MSGCKNLLAYHLGQNIQAVQEIGYVEDHIQSQQWSGWRFLPFCLLWNTDMYGSLGPLKLIPFCCLPIVMKQKNREVLWKLMWEVKISSLWTHKWMHTKNAPAHILESFHLFDNCINILSVGITNSEGYQIPLFKSQVLHRVISPKYQHSVSHLWYISQTYLSGLEVLCKVFPPLSHPCCPIDENVKEIR